MKSLLLPIVILVQIIGMSYIATAQPVKLGASSYVLAPKGADPKVPKALNRTAALLPTAAQSAQWYSSILYSAKPEAVFVQPITVRTTAAGLEFALPSKEVIPTERQDTVIQYPHRDPIIISPMAFEPGLAKLAKADDWSVDISMARGADDMRVTVAHGNPYAQLRFSRGDVRVKLPSPGDRVDSGGDPRTLALKIKDKSYALFGPTGARWEMVSATEWIVRMPAGKDYLSVAALPDSSAQTLMLFTKHAYSFIENTSVDWKYDAASSKVETTFRAVTKAMEGADTGPLLGLYPHHWFNNPSVESSLGASYDTIRGKIRLLAASGFKTSSTYTGFVPYWPAVAENQRSADLRDVMKIDQRNARRMMLEEGKGPYWQGKGLQRILKLMDVVEQQGDLEGRNRLLELVKSRAEQWLGGEDSMRYFHLDKDQGTLASYPEEFFTIEQLNDHHFTYGYWIRAAADIALRDPKWASKEQWGGMVDLIIADIATSKRGSSEFPFLRNFDPYEGHSWASGIGMGEMGNNQESSSEAINAWAGLILWGEIKGDRALRDLGLYLYTTEIEAVNHYWFDIHGKVLAPEYKNIEVSQLFGGMYAHNTWWADDPRQIKGINLLPITTASTYLAKDPAFVNRNVASLKPEIALFEARGKRVTPPDIWQDIFAKYLGLADPAAGLARWNRWGSFELGETRSHALHWLLSLQEMGTPDFSVTADTTLFSVFKKPDGKKTYLAFNAGASPLNVVFSDGKKLTVAPNSLGRTQ
ncbi:glycosyl hydrolase [Undibacterium sp.]|uniref:glycosyl hydrolase n=1 Tax=Undibacterium sp. TaxID=1914977 RepID=UPI003753CC8E